MSGTMVWKIWAVVGEDSLSSAGMAAESRTLPAYAHGAISAA